MILVDSSVWVQHFREGNKILQNLLNEGLVLCHPFIIGELSCGNLRQRNKVISLIQELPSLPQLDINYIMQFIENSKLMGRGVGFIDIHLLASTLVADATIWTLDKRLKEIAMELGVSYENS